MAASIWHVQRSVLQSDDVAKTVGEHSRVAGLHSHLQTEEISPVTRRYTLQVPSALLNVAIVLCDLQV